ncbi:MAG: TIGR03905 family TSCPD domain-containing protein [Bacilli bacterium]|nr:TIGR03905 family TSCPD domain-containing protein [Bacilli bacterium]
MKTIEYTPTGVCSRKMIVSADDNIITEVKIIGGCPGNTIGVSKLCIGKNIDEVIELLKGVPCGMRTTSCPDQLSKALTMLKETN